MHVSPDGANKAAPKGSEGQDEKKKGDVWTLLRRSPQGLKVSTCVHKGLKTVVTLLWAFPFRARGVCHYMELPRGLTYVLPLFTGVTKKSAPFH